VLVVDLLVHEHRLSFERLPGTSGRLDSTHFEETDGVAVSAHATAHQRVDADAEKIVGRLSLESTVSAPRWQADVSSGV
jgi:hypothetical protein